MYYQIVVKFALLSIFYCSGAGFVIELCAQPEKETDIENKISALVGQMTLEEKLGQLTLYTCDLDKTGPTVRKNYMEDIKKGRVGALFNAFSTDFTRRLQKTAVEETRLKIPLLFGYDVVHGFKTIFPIPLAEAASWDLPGIEQSARTAAIEASAAGLHWTFAPMVDIARDPRWGRIAEGAGEDPYLGSAIARARVRGFQGQDLSATDTILACAKHFTAYGAAEAGRDYNTVSISQRLLYEIYLPPFRAAVDEGVGSVMTAFNDLDGVPCTGNRWLITGLLRGEWKFTGFVVSDYTSILEMIPHGFAVDPAHAGTLAITAGVDIDMESGIYLHELAGAVENGKIDEKIIDDAVKRVLRWKFRLGLFDNPYAYCDSEREQRLLLNQKHLEIALAMAQKSIVLLKNDGQTLPLAKDIRKVAIIGPLADDRHELLGSWCAAGDYHNAVSVFEGIKKAVSASTEVLYAPGCSLEDVSTEGFVQAEELSRKADAVIMVLGEKALMSGEAASRSSLNLPGVQELLLQKIYATGKPVILILMNGRPLTINWAGRNISAILECWFLGTRTGDAVAQVIFGDFNPCGKLPVTFPRSVGQIPLYYNYRNTGRPRSDDKYTSKYLDIENEPLYPFGYGLSYTTFTYSGLRLSKTPLRKGENLEVFVTVQNSGTRGGTEVVQLYLHDQVASNTRPVKELRGFQRVNLGVGEAQEVHFTLHPEDFAFYGHDLHPVIEPGTFQIMVGGNSVDLISTAFELIE